MVKLNAAERDFFATLRSQIVQIEQKLQEMHKTIEYYVMDVVEDHNLDKEKKWKLDNNGLNIIEEQENVTKEL